MNEDLQFSALHADDALLDALGGRVPGAALGVAAGVPAEIEGDPIARLLGAYVAEIDSRPGPLSGLLGTEPAEAAAAPADRALVPAAGTSWAAYEAAPAVLPLPRRRRMLAPKAVAVTTTGALVLGLGGVAAATGSSPLDPLRRAVGSVGGPLTPGRTPAERAGQYLDQAEQALNRGDLVTAANDLAQVQRLLALISDPDLLRSLQAQLDALRERWQRVMSPAAAAMGKPGTAGAAGSSANPTTTGFIAPPGQAPQTLVPGTGVTDPTDELPAMREDNIDHAKNQLKDRAKEKLGHPLPDRQHPLPGDIPPPVGWRGPAGTDLAHQTGAYLVLYHLAGKALSQPKPADAARALADSTHPKGPSS
jgi:hypothetical protein